ncbi:kinesin family member C1 [Fusarium albosuccineum]|uniref:Kinesin-like protein n=1 Tax=Fusarium albosuccineum TaxID=1237068 RepID=A0A8H4LLW5_9HYPO|nr:kinesin family member C1 [Fusarium albosuccineum]
MPPHVATDVEQLAQRLTQRCRHQPQHARPSHRREQAAFGGTALPRQHALAPEQVNKRLRIANLNAESVSSEAELGPRKPTRSTARSRSQGPECVLLLVTASYFISLPPTPIFTTPSSTAARTGGALLLFIPVLVSVFLYRERNLVDMDAAENPSFRSSKMSRLPAPSTAIGGGGGLTEWSESQHNARIQSTVTSLASLKNLKREIPQPAPQSEAKRKPLSDRALEYPTKPTSLVAATSAARSNMKAQSLAGMSGLKQPSSFQTSRSGMGSNFAKSVGPGRHAPSNQPQATRMHPRPGHARSKSQAPRPRTAHGLRDEDRYEPAPSNNTWDVDGRVVDMESQFKELKEMVNTTLSERKGQEDALDLAKNRVKELENDREKLEMRNDSLKSDLDAAREEGRQIRHEIEKQKWEYQRRMDDQERKHRETMEDLARQHRSSVDELGRELDRLKEQETKDHAQRLENLTRQYQQQLEDERQKMSREVQDLRTRMGNEHQDMGMSLQRKERELQEVQSQAEGLRGDLERERTLKNSLQTNIAELSAANTTLEAKINSLRSHVEFLESDSKAQSDSFASMESRLQEALRMAEEAQQKLIKEETERRVLFNKYQELKGNIRVMCRVRPALSESEGEVAKMSFPDDKTSAEIVLAGPEEKSSLGNVTRKNYPFEFDRVFIPGTQNQEIFGEISQLVQSALDGYNVCIFCYGQTGSGKTHTMSSTDGMIPRATHMIYDTITKLKEKSWEYTMEGSFIEVYNEELNDLLTPERSGEGRSKKLEIRHDEARKQTTIVNCKTVRLNSPSSVETMLDEAQNNRSVAATKANERSSRSHSVFILKLVGENSATGERCEGTLNLVDLAGSERLKHSQAEGDRMKETQNINKSLSCLGDVIEALGRGTGHVPYRNSKLTHLLQYSLGGNSKTLMFVMVSPLETHLKETLTSLRFATKVHNTHIGTAKATKKVRDSS